MIKIIDINRTLNDTNYSINNLRFMLVMIKVGLMIKILSLSVTPKNSTNAIFIKHMDMIYVNDIKFTSFKVKITTANDIYQNETRVSF